MTPLSSASPRRPAPASLTTSSMHRPYPTIGPSPTLAPVVLPAPSPPTSTRRPSATYLPTTTTTRTNAEVAEVVATDTPLPPRARKANNADTAPQRVTAAPARPVSACRHRPHRRGPMLSATRIGMILRVRHLHGGCRASRVRGRGRDGGNIRGRACDNGMHGRRCVWRKVELKWGWTKWT